MIRHDLYVRMSEPHLLYSMDATAKEQFLQASSPQCRKHVFFSLGGTVHNVLPLEETIELGALPAAKHGQSMVRRLDETVLATAWVDPDHPCHLRFLGVNVTVEAVLQTKSCLRIGKGLQKQIILNTSDSGDSPSLLSGLPSWQHLPGSRTEEL